MYKNTVIHVIVPAYNEEAHIGAVVAGVPAYVDRVVVVDDCSTDGTAGVVERCGDPRVTLLRMRKAGVLISLSFDATSIAPPNMFETMRFTWNMGIPWRGTPSEDEPPIGFRDVIEMATIDRKSVV